MTLALIQQRQRALPTGVRWPLVADRGFPSAALFAPLRQGGTDCRVRRRLSDWVTVGQGDALVVDHFEAGRLGVERRTTATMGCGRPNQPLVAGWIVVSPAVAAPPQHKQNPGTLRERAARARRPAQHRNMLSAPFFLGLGEVFRARSDAPPELTLDAPCERQCPGLSFLLPPLGVPFGQAESHRHVPAYRHHVPLDACCASRGWAVYSRPEASGLASCPLIPFIHLGAG
jgi:hypothetical protein